MLYFIFYYLREQCPNIEQKLHTSISVCLSSIYYLSLALLSFYLSLIYLYTYLFIYLYTYLSTYPAEASPKTTSTLKYMHFKKFHWWHWQILVGTMILLKNKPSDFSYSNKYHILKELHSQSKLVIPNIHN